MAAAVTGGGVGESILDEVERGQVASRGAKERGVPRDDARAPLMRQSRRTIAAAAAAAARAAEGDTSRAIAQRWLKKG